MIDGPTRYARDGDAHRRRGASIDELLDRAVPPSIAVIVQQRRRWLGTCSPSTGRTPTPRICCIEAGQLNRAAVLAAELIDQAERHGLEGWLLTGATQRAAVSALTSLIGDDPDPTELSAHVTTMTTLLDTLRAHEVNMYSTFYDTILGRLLTAAGQPEQARRQLDTGLQLARDTGMCFYDAELLRLRAHTHTDQDARVADLGAALELARRQGATLFELRAALDDFELQGEAARGALIDAASRIPANNAWPELARAQARLSEHSPQR